MSMQMNFITKNNNNNKTQASRDLLPDISTPMEKQNSPAFDTLMMKNHQKSISNIYVLSGYLGFCSGLAVPCSHKYPLHMDGSSIAVTLHII